MISPQYNLASSDLTFARVIAHVRGDLALALVCLLIFLLPLYRAPYLEDSFILPKVGLTLGVLALVLITLLFSQQRRVSLCVADVLIVLFLLWNVAGLMYANSPPLAYQGITYLTTYVAFYIVCRLTVRGVLAVAATLTCALAGAIVTAAWVCIEDATRLSGISSLVPKLPDWRGYLAAGLGNSGHIAGLICMLLPFALVLFLSRKRTNPPLLLAIMLMFAALTVTWSIGSTGSGILAICLWATVAWFSGLRAELTWKRLLWVFGAGILVVLFFMLPHPINPHHPSLWSEAFGSERWKEGGATRVVIWKTTLEVLRHHWFLGIGSGNFTREYVMVTVPSVINDPHMRIYAGGFTNEAHNEYLQVWTENGIPGLVIYLSIFISFYVGLLRGWKSQPTAGKLLVLACGAAVTVFLLDSLMTFPLRLPAHFGYLMLALAGPAALDSGDRGRSVSIRMAATATLLLVVACVAVQGPRFMAASKLKQARTLAESQTITSSGPIAPWNYVDQLFQAGAAAFARGDRVASEIAFRAARDASTAPPFPHVERLLRQALAYDKYYSNASSRLSALLLFQGRASEAQNISARTLITLEAFEIHERLGWAAWMQGDKTTAALHWGICAQRRPQMANYYNGLIEQLQNDKR